MQDVSVIIPNFNGKKYLKECLDSLRKQDYLYFEVILVDNGSEDGSVEWTKENYPEVRVIVLKENTGFCGGVNAGIRESKSEYVLLLNNDTIVFPEFITELVHAIERAPDIFSCQAKMLQIQDESKMDDAGNFYCALGWAFADGKGKPESEYNKTREIFASCAGAAIYRKEILDEIKTKGTSKERMRKAGQYCVQIYGDFFGKLNGAGMLQLVSEDIQDFYELVSMDQYSEDYGLDYAMDNGIAIFV